MATLTASCSLTLGFRISSSAKIFFLWVLLAFSLQLVGLLGGGGAVCFYFVSSSKHTHITFWSTHNIKIQSQHHSPSVGESVRTLSEIATHSVSPVTSFTVVVRMPHTSTNTKFVIEKWLWNRTFYIFDWTKFFDQNNSELEFYGKPRPSISLRWSVRILSYENCGYLHYYIEVLWWWVLQKVKTRKDVS